MYGDPDRPLTPHRRSGALRRRGRGRRGGRSGHLRVFVCGTDGAARTARHARKYAVRNARPRRSRPPAHPHGRRPAPIIPGNRAGKPPRQPRRTRIRPRTRGHTPTNRRRYTVRQKSEVNTLRDGEKARAAHARLAAAQPRPEARGARGRGPPGGGRRPLGHTSELADPAPYMEGGELLLITGLKLDAGRPGHSALRGTSGRRGVVGLGFAVGVNYDGVPKALVDAAGAQRLPLLEVPRRTPFLAISKASPPGIAADQYRAVTAGFAAQRELTRQALSPDGPAALLARLAAQVDGWAALYDASGAVRRPPRRHGRGAGRRGSPATWSGCGSGRRRRARWWPEWPARRPGATASNCTPWAPGAARGGARRGHGGARWAPPSGTPCTRRSPC